MLTIQARVTTWGLGPAALFEVVMDRGPPEDPSAPGELVVADLDDIAHRFEDEDEADQGEQQPLPRHQSHDRETRSQCQCPGVAHDDHGRVGVEPEVAEVGARDDERKGRDERLPLQEGDHAVGDEGDESRPAGQGIETVRDRNRCGRRHDHGHRDRDVEESQLGAPQPGSIDRLNVHLVV